MNFEINPISRGQMEMIFHALLWLIALRSPQPFWPHKNRVNDFTYFHQKSLDYLFKTSICDMLGEVTSAAPRRGQSMGFKLIREGLLQGLRYNSKSFRARLFLHEIFFNNDSGYFRRRGNPSLKQHLECPHNKG